MALVRTPPNLGKLILGQYGEALIPLLEGLSEVGISRACQKTAALFLPVFQPWRAHFYTEV